VPVNAGIGINSVKRQHAQVRDAIRSRRKAYVSKASCAKRFPVFKFCENVGVLISQNDSENRDRNGLDNSTTPETWPIFKIGIEVWDWRTPKAYSNTTPSQEYMIRPTRHNSVTINDFAA
jgi:hypothetical protein